MNVQQLMTEAIKDDTPAMVFYYHRDSGGGAWLLSYNWLNPEEDAMYRAFSSQSKLRKWVRSEYPNIKWESRDSGLWTGIALMRDDQTGVLDV